MAVKEVSDILEVQTLNVEAIACIIKDFQMLANDFHLFKKATQKDIKFLIKENEELKKRIEALEKK